MPRQARQASGTGIYHVMMRGINHQNIFEEQEDYYQFLNALDMMALSYEPDGTPSGRNYFLYAYCLMSNHIHLLIREREDTIGMAIKRIASSYVYYYNHKYSRDGHLFRERYKSEPVNDMAYFVTLLRYIHQNPVKAGIVNRVNDYEFSSWHEYEDKLRISIRYKEHRDVAEEMLWRAKAYNMGHWTSFGNALNTLGITEEDKRRFLMGTYVQRDEIYLRPLAKMAQDVAKAAGIRF